MSLASDSNRDCIGLESDASAGWASEGLKYQEFSACFVVLSLHIYSSCVTEDIVVFGAVALVGALSSSPIVSGGFGLAAGIMGLAAGIINGKDGDNGD